LKILGNIVSDGMVKPDPEKVTAIKEYKLLTTIQELRSFLGLANYCRDYIPNYAKKTITLNDMLKGETKKSIRKIEWSDKKIEDFKKIKDLIFNITYRSQPDINKRFILTTDASSQAIDAILAQEDKEGKRRMIYAFSRKMEKAQLNYSVTDKELLALVKGIEHFRHFLIGKEFTVETDHKALEYLWQAKDQNTRLLRLALKLQEYSFIPNYIEAKIMQLMDSVYIAIV
jgi:hypothetical protein